MQRLPGRLQRTAPRIFLSAVFALLAVGAAQARPLIFHRGVVNAASFQPPGTPGGAIAQGSIFTIFGRAMGPATPAQVSAFPLRSEFQGVSIEVIQGARSAQAIPLFVSAGQINAIMPSDAPIGQVSVRVAFEGETSNPITAAVARHNPGIFTATGGGIGPAIVQNFISQTERPINSPRLAATPGQVVTLWATGLGPITGEDSEPPPVGNLPYNLEIFVGGALATNVLYSGRAPMISALDQIAFEIPAGAPLGCYVPVHLRVEGEAVSNSATIAVKSADTAGSACEEDANPFLTALLSGGSVGALDLFRISMQNDVDIPTPTSFSIDRAGAYFRREAGGAFPFNPLFAVPPPGACTAYALRGDVLAGASPPFTPRPGLDAGLLRWNGPNGEISLQRDVEQSPGLYPVKTVGETDGEPLDLTPGAYSLTGSGGADIGPIAADADVSGPLDWSNRDEFEEVSRGGPVHVSWSGGGEAPVFVGGISIDRPNDASALFLCLAPPGNSFFEIPSVVLRNLPASRRVLGQSRGFLFIGGVPQLSEFIARGLDIGAVLTGSIQTKTVRWTD